MKKLKKLIVLFTAALFCLLPIISQPLTAQASTPTTYYLKYIEANGAWRYLKDDLSWDATDSHRDLYYMHQDLKDGDIIVIDSNQPIELTVNVKLSNLTILNSTLAVVTANGYDEVHVSNSSIAAINGDVKSGNVYTNATVNFNNNVQDLYVDGSSIVYVIGNITNLKVYDPIDPVAKINCSGTVNYVKTYCDSRVFYECYSFPAGTMEILNGSMITDASKYSTTAPAVTVTPSAPSAGSSAGEYDDVPKTGDFSVSPVWFLAIAAICMLGYLKLERR